MKGIIEKIKKNKVVSIITLVVVVLVIIIIILLLTGSVSVRKLSFNNQEAAAIESGVITVEEGNVSLASSDIYIKNTETVTFPVFANGDMFDYEGDIASCDSEIVWVTAEVEPTPAILNATLEKMFNFKNDPSYIPYNFVEEQGNLSFREAKIVDGIAEIYLDGELDINNECEADKPWIQLEEAALVFDTVEGVQIFLNDELMR